jgi:rSAM/selenodomain-associated transferase 1
VIIMTKLPRIGRVKTRLARQVGAVEAVRFVRVTLAILIRRLAGDPRFETLVAVAAPQDLWSRMISTCVRRLHQGGGDLGRRMAHLANAAPAGPVVIVGTDIPGITAGAIARAFAMLGRADVVLGPAADGGYWLIGFSRRRPPPRHLSGVRWSSEHALADTITALGPRVIGITDQLTDVDSAFELRSLGAAAGRTIPPRT